MKIFTITFFLILSTTAIAENFENDSHIEKIEPEYLIHFDTQSQITLEDEDC